MATIRFTQIWVKLAHAYAADTRLSLFFSSVRTFGEPGNEARNLIH